MLWLITGPNGVKLAGGVDSSLKWIRIISSDTEVFIKNKNSIKINKYVILFPTDVFNFTCLDSASKSYSFGIRLIYCWY